ncbi:hypothetical protein [Synechococcus sp. UW179A]|uniref:hypothetical protein n=1 Tax=Synechococcus sp. UW179A TaxID=2575510 RepID=UPI0010BE6037|nr:hypothetical protein [Synechococcus sp. UW179A]
MPKQTLFEKHDRSVFLNGTGAVFDAKYYKEHVTMLTSISMPEELKDWHENLKPNGSFRYRESGALKQWME